MYKMPSRKHAFAKYLALFRFGMIYQLLVEIS